MARVLTIVLLLGLLGQTFAQETFSAADLRRDFEFIVQTIQDVHPNPHIHISEAELEQLQAQVENQLDEPLTAQAFYEVAGSYVNGLEDSHTFMLLESTLNADSLEYRVDQSRERRAYTQINGVGVLDLPSFWLTPNEQDEARELEEFSDFFEESFKRFSDKGVTRLVIDLRNNSGGNSSVGDALTAYITDEPYRMFASSEVKVSQQLIDWWERVGMETPEDFSERIGEKVVETFSLESPPPIPLRFEGEVFVLTSQGTASSAMDFAAVVKDFQIGTIVGEETGDLPTHVGDSIIFTLPTTGLELRVSHKYFVRPGDFDDGRGVLPDCEVEASQALQAVLSGECQAISP